MFEPPVFNILSIGLDGCGKTVYLASLYNKLMVYSASIGFSLSAEESQSAELIDIANAVNSDDRDFPSGTLGHEEYVFDCNFPGATGAETFCKFKYVDFAGAFIRAKGDFRSVHLKDRIAAAHSILVLLDGKKIRDVFDGLKSRPSLFDDLTSLLSYLGGVLGANKPIHIVVTKSDLLDVTLHNLKMIQGVILRHPGFKQFVQEHTRTAKMRIVPVSSIGPGFAYYDRGSGAMQKVVGASVRPQNIELSLALAVHDHFVSMSRLPDPDAGAALSAKQDLAHTLSLKRLVAQVSIPWVRRVPSIMLGTGLGKAAILGLLARTEARVAEQQTTLDLEMKGISRIIDNRRAALLTALDRQISIVKRLDQALPENDMSLALVEPR